MGDLIKSLTNGEALRRFVFSWFLPLLVFVIVFVGIAIDEVNDWSWARSVRANLAQIDVSGSSGLLLLIVAGAFLAMTISRPFFRMAEGYGKLVPLVFKRRHEQHRLQQRALWAQYEYDLLVRVRVPRAGRDLDDAEEKLQANPGHRWAVDAERLARAKFVETVHELAAALVEVDQAAATPPTRWRWSGTPSYVWDRRERYTEKTNRVMATRFGNAMRSMETYGVDVFGLDSQTLWYELVSVAPEEVGKSLQNSRITTDFFLATFLYSIAFGIVGAAAFVAEMFHAGLLVFTLATVAVGVAAYRGMCWSAGAWGETVRALVHIARKPLAEAMGFTLPKTLQAERRMWAALAGASAFRSEDWASRLDSHRS